MKVLLTRTFQVASADLELNLDAVMESLIELEGERLSDSDGSAVLSEGLVEVWIVAYSGVPDESEALGDAVAHADAAIRTAIHKAGGHTPHWQIMSLNVEELETA